MLRINLLLIVVIIGSYSFRSSILRWKQAITKSVEEAKSCSFITFISYSIPDSVKYIRDLKGRKSVFELPKVDIHNFEVLGRFVK